MPALNFKAKFAEAVEYGYKRQTIRAPRKDGRPHCRVGETLKLYTGMRTKSCRLLRTATVTRTAKVRIEDTKMFIDGNRLPTMIHERNCETTDNKFAQADGFEDGFIQMAEWFRGVHGLPFEGTVIYWE
jgi:hypothetical protein